MTEQEKGCPGCGYIGTFFGMFCDNCSVSRQIKEQEPEKIKMTKPKATTGLDKWLDDSFGSGNDGRYDAWTGAIHLLEVSEKWYDSTDFDDCATAESACNLIKYLKNYCGREG